MLASLNLFWYPFLIMSVFLDLFHIPFVLQHPLLSMPAFLIFFRHPFLFPARLDPLTYFSIHWYWRVNNPALTESLIHRHILLSPSRAIRRSHLPQVANSQQLSVTAPDHALNNFSKDHRKHSRISRKCIKPLSRAPGWAPARLPYTSETFQGFTKHSTISSNKPYKPPFQILARGCKSNGNILTSSIFITRICMPSII